MARGRKPVPTEVKKIRGTMDKSRVLKDEMKGRKVNKYSIPSPPDWLNETGKKEWYSTATSLAEIGMLSNLDLSILAVYCNQMAVHIDTEKLLREQTRVLFFKDDNGRLKYAQAVPYQKISEKALDNALKIAVEFGFTPASRTKISMEQAKLPNSVSDDENGKRYEFDI